jgi:hypothetical protein
MPVVIVSYQVKEDSVPDVEAGIARMMTAIKQAQPPGIRYALAKLPDGVSFVGLLELADGVENPLPTIPAAAEFQGNLAGWVTGEPPVPAPLEVVGSYRWFN